MRSILACLVALVLVVCVTIRIAEAQGFFGGLIDKVLPGVGTALDDLHDQVKDAVPLHKAIEEGASHLVNETVVQATAPLLQAAIIESREDALRNGVQPVPDIIRRNLAGFIPADTLDAARFRVRGGGDLSLQVNSIRYGEAAAITLDWVIVFANENDARFNPTLWAHELTHVRQYRSWGLRDFAISYVRDYQGVEREAYEAETRSIAWTAQQNMRSMGQNSRPQDPFGQPIASFGQPSLSSACGTAFGVCILNGAASVGTPCWCATQMGPAVGSLVPGGPIPRGFPSGQVMALCGCWGPPAPSAPEPRCESGFVTPTACPAYCPAGGFAYGWVCR